MPGFVDMHVHGSGRGKAPDLSYAYKLWLAHGVTTVRGVSLSGAEVASSEKNRSAKNEIAAPRIINYQTLGSGWPNGPVTSADKAREWVRWAAANNIDGIKFFNRGDETPEIITAAIDEAHKNKMGTVAHLSQNGVANFNGRDAGEAHLDAITHYYGHMESLLKDKTIQDYPIGYDYNNEQDRFGDIARIWNQTYEPGSKEWIAYLEQQKKNKVTFDPTFNIYAASRDLMRARNADWHQAYTMPQLWNYFQSTRDNHGSYFYDWTTENEYHWKMFYQRYMRLMNDYKNMGGRVTVGTDSGFIWKTYGFAYVEELELLREAGFSPLEIIRSATMWGARTLYEPKGEAPPMGVVRTGMLADLVITTENPLSNLKTLYGTGHMRLNDADQSPGEGRRREVHDQGRHCLRRAEAAGGSGRGRGGGEAHRHHDRVAALKTTRGGTPLRGSTRTLPARSSEADDGADGELHLLQRSLAKAERVAEAAGLVVVQQRGLVANVATEAECLPGKVLDAAAEPERQLGLGLKVVAGQEGGAETREHERAQLARPPLRTGERRCRATGGWSC